MRYITLEQIKANARIEPDFHEDDALLESIGDGAESYLEAHLNQELDDIVAENSGELPIALCRALLLMVDYLYDNSGSGETKPVPQAYFILTAPWKRYSIA